MKRRHVYGRMSGQDLSQALYELGVSRTGFARITGSKEDRVAQWIKDEEDIPHWANVLCALLRMPGALDVANGVTDRVVRDKREGEP